MFLVSFSQTLTGQLELEDDKLATTLTALGAIAEVDPMAFEIHQHDVIANFIVRDMLKTNRVCCGKLAIWLL